MKNIIIFLVCYMIATSIADGKYLPGKEFENDAVTVHFTPKDSADAAIIKKIDFYHLNEGFLYRAKESYKKEILVDGPRNECNNIHPRIINDEMDITLYLVRPFFHIGGYSNITLEAVSELNDGNVVSKFSITYPKLSLESELNITGQYKGQDINEKGNMKLTYEYMTLKMTVTGKSKVTTPLYTNVYNSFEFGNASCLVEDSKTIEKIDKQELLKVADRTNKEIMQNEFARANDFLVMFNKDIDKMVKEGVINI